MASKLSKKIGAAVMKALGQRPGAQFEVGEDHAVVQFNVADSGECYIYASRVTWERAVFALAALRGDFDELILGNQQQAEASPQRDPKGVE